MQAAEKRKQEQEEQKKIRIEHILKCTYDLFSHGIDTITMNQIAENAEIGVASLYRYFSTKEQLAIECASYAWNMESEKFNSSIDYSEFQEMNGYNQIYLIINLFPKFLVTEGKFFRFIYYFDAFIKNQNISQTQLTSYEETIIKPEKVIIDSIKKGIEDKSIKSFDSTAEELFLTLSHTLFSFAQKLSLTGELLYMDKSVPSVKQMELIISIILSSLKN